KVRMPDSYVEYNLDIRDSELGHIDMDDFWVRTNQTSSGLWMNKLVGSELHFTAGLH
ncbi:hypothetical protein KI387_044452, partial [Taxus chinensis]